MVFWPSKLQLSILKKLTGLYEDAPALLWQRSLSNHCSFVSLSSLNTPPPALKHASWLHPVPARPGYAQLDQFLSRPTSAEHKKTIIHSLEKAKNVSLLYVWLSVVPVVEAELPPHTVCIPEIQYRGFPPGRALWDEGSASETPHSSTYPRNSPSGLVSVSFHSLQTNTHITMRI